MKYIFLLVTLYCIWACEDVEREPIVIDTIAPAKVKNVVVKSIPGGAEITYDLPEDVDLLYIQAKYTLPNGKNVLINASRNTRTLTIEGFAEVKEYEVTLTSFDTSGNFSEPYRINVIPDVPPVTAVFNTLRVQEDFGGINLQWDNPTEAELAILIQKKDSIGEWEIIDTYYTSQKEGNYSVRGLSNVESEFAVQLRDKWSNYSKLYTDTLTPLYETQLSSQNMEFLDYAYTSNIPMSDMGRLSMMWDEKFEDNVTTDSKIPWYISFAVDKQPIKLSRIVIWQYAWPFNNYGHYYAGGNGYLYEIYGTSDDTPTIDMSGWTLLTTCEIVKPSGLPCNIGRDNMSTEDFELAHDKGHEFIFPLDAPAVKYLRIRSLECYGGILGTFSEIQLYGSPSKE